MSVEKVRVTPELVEAMRMLKADNDWSDYRLAQELKTTPTSIFRWMNYKASYIKRKNADILLPLVKDYLEEINKRKEGQGPVKLPQSLEDVIEKIRALHEYDPKLLNNIAGFLDSTLEFVLKVAPPLENRRKNPAKIKIKKLSKKAIALKQENEDNFYTPIDQPNDIEAAAGMGCIYDYEYAVPSMSKRNDIDVINVIGNSMEPYIKEGSRVVVQRFAQPVDFGELYLPEESVKSLVPEGSIVIYNLNDSGLAIKKVRYVTHEKDGGPEWSLYLEAVNPEWAQANGFPKRITMQDRLVIYGKMIGQAE